MLDEMQARSDQSNTIDSKNYELKILKRQIKMSRLLLVRMQKAIKSGPIDKHFVPEFTESEIRGIDKVILEEFEATFDDFPIFDFFSDELKIHFFRNMEKNLYSAKHFIYREGLPSEKAMFLISGEVHLCFMFTVDHKIEYFEFMKLRPGCMMGVVEAVLTPALIDEICDEFRTLLPNRGKEAALNLYSSYCAKDAVFYEMERAKFSDMLEISKKSKTNIKNWITHYLRAVEYSRASLIVMCKQVVATIQDDYHKDEAEKKELMIKNQVKIFGEFFDEEFQNKVRNQSMFSSHSVFYFGGVKLDRFEHIDILKENEEIIIDDVILEDDDWDALDVKDTPKKEIKIEIPNKKVKSKMKNVPNIPIESGLDLRELRRQPSISQERRISSFENSTKIFRGRGISSELDSEIMSPIKSSMKSRIKAKTTRFDANELIDEFDKSPKENSAPMTNYESKKVNRRQRRMMKRMKIRKKRNDKKKKVDNE